MAAQQAPTVEGIIAGVRAVGKKLVDARPLGALLRHDPCVRPCAILYSHLSRALPAETLRHGAGTLFRCGHALDPGPSRRPSRARAPATTPRSRHPAPTSSLACSPLSGLQTRAALWLALHNGQLYDINRIYADMPPVSPALTAAELVVGNMVRRVLHIIREEAEGAAGGASGGAEDAASDSGSEDSGGEGGGGGAGEGGKMKAFKQEGPCTSSRGNSS